jgi:hypothetical protein
MVIGVGCANHPFVERGIGADPIAERERQLFERAFRNGDADLDLCIVLGERPVADAAGDDDSQAYDRAVVEAAKVVASLA